VRRFYSILLYLFPRTYREEYGDELWAVFNLSLDDAWKAGRLETLGLTLRELSGLPGAILYELLRERRKTHMLRKFGSHFNFTYGSRREFITAMVPFFWMGFILPLMNVLTSSGLLIPRSPVVNGIGILLVACLGILFLIGLVTGLPRWSMPYIGFTAAIFSVGMASSSLELIRRRLPRLYEPYVSMGDFMFGGTWWFGLLLVVILFVMLTRSIPALRRYKDDWTLGCFVPYGAVPFALVLTFDAYRNDEPFIVLAFLILILGAWFYLRGEDKWKKFMMLFGGLTLSMFIGAAGKVFLLPMQDWLVHIDPSYWKVEVMATIIMWMWLALIMLIPIALNLLPWSKDHLQTV